MSKTTSLPLNNPFSTKTNTTDTVSANLPSPDEGPSDNYDNLRRKSFSDADKVNIESAMEYCEIGVFQTLIIIPCMIAFSTTSIIPNILSKFNQAIQCDYQFTDDDKDVLNDIVYTCMVLGGAGWSVIADIQSRKWTLIFVLLTNAISSVGLSLSNSFLTFGLFRALGTFSLSGIIVVTIVYLAEFQSRYNRGSMICCLQLAWILGIVFVAELSFVWDKVILCAAIPPVIAIFALICFPDSPRFYLSRGREMEAIKSLRMIYSFNTGKDSNTFPIRHLIDNQTAEEINETSVVKQYIPREMKPHFVCFIVLMLSQFILLFGYFTMALYFPDLSAREEFFFPSTKYYYKLPSDCQIGIADREEIYETTEEISDIDLVKAKLNQSLRTSNRIFSTKTPQKVSKKAENPCEKINIKNEEYYSGRRMLIAFCCIPSVIWLVYRVDSRGRKPFIIFSHVLIGILVFASYFVRTSNQSLIFCCCFEAFTLVSIAASHCLAVDLFSTRIRVLGVSLIVGSSQLGVIIGNIAVATRFMPTCVLIVSVIAYLLTISGLLIMIIPNTTASTLK